MKALLIFASLIALISATGTYTSKWVSCGESTDNWFPHNVTVHQNPQVKEVVTLNACGTVAASGWYVTFSTLFINGEINDDYTWNATIDLHNKIVVTGLPLCYNYTTYIPDLKQTEVLINLNAVDTFDFPSGCLNITLTTSNSSFI